MTKTSVLLSVKKYKVVFLIGLFLLVYWGKLKYDFSKIVNNGTIGICYVISYNTRGKSGPYLKYIYYINNEKLINSVTTNGKVQSYQKGKYYRIKYLKDNPSESVLYLDKQITDSITIAKFKVDMLRSKELEIEAIRDKQLKN